MSEVDGWTKLTSILSLVGALTLAFALFVGGWQGWDLPSWDGAWYFGWAHDLASRGQLPSAESSPVYCAYQAVFHLLFEDAYTIWFVQRVVALLGIVALGWALFVRVSPLLAAPAAGFLLLLSFEVGPTAYTARPFVLVPLLGACLFAVSSWRWRGIGVVVCAALAAGVRPELGWTFPVLVIGAVWLERHRLRGAGSRGRVALLATLALGLVLAVPVITASTAPSKRSILAFGQHYGVGYLKRNPTADGDPWLLWPEFLEGSFGEVDTIPQAAQANPGAFARHLVWNAGNLPRNASLGLLPEPRIPEAARPALAWLPAASLALLLPLAWRSRRRRGLDLPWRDHALLGLLLACALLGSGVSALVIYPRSFLFQGLRILWLLLLLAGLQELLGRRLRGRWLGLGTALAVGVCLLLWPRPARELPPRQVLPQLASVQGVLAEAREPIGVLAYDARALCSYARDERCLAVHVHWVRPQPEDVEAYLARERVEVMVLEPALVIGLSDPWKDYLRRMAQAPDHLGWEKLGQGFQYEIVHRPLSP